METAILGYYKLFDLEAPRMVGDTAVSVGEI